METGVPRLVRSFSSYQDFHDYLEREIKGWDWLNDNDIANLIPNNPYGAIVNGWRHVLGQIPAYQNRPSNYEASLKSLLDGYMIGNRIPISGTPTFRALEEMKESNKLSAGFAVAIRMNHLQPTGNFAHFSAAFELLTIEMGLTRKSVAASKKALDENLAVQLSQFAEVAEKTRTQRMVFEKERKRTRRFLSSTMRAQKNMFRASQLENKTLADGASQRLADIEVAYKEHMKLKAPVAYWSHKAIEHKTRAAKYSKILAVFALIGGAGLVVALLFLSNHAIDIASQEKPNAVYFILATIGVVCSTIVFWVARVLTRLFLSEHHLAIDSEERSTMVETYLALTLDGKITDAERALVLASLFRPTADGIVKDDAAPDISPASIISKVISQRS